MKPADQVVRQKKAFREGMNRSFESRKKNLLQLRQLISENERELCDAINRDFGKPYSDAYVTEIYTVIQEIDFHLKHLENWMKPKGTGSILATFPSKSYIYKHPFGTVLVIAPWNYPLYLAMMPVIGAISAGNTVVLKPSEISSNTSAKIHELFKKNFDEKLIAIIEGGSDTANELLKQPFDKIFYTGNARVGKLVMKAAAEQLIPVTLELGGKSPAIVHKDVSAAVSARRIWWGKTINAGQTCVAPDFVLIHENQADSFINESKKALELFFQNEFRPGDNFTNIINRKHFDRLENHLQNSDILFGGSSDIETLFIEPTLVRSDWDDEIMQEEIFGPILPMLTYSDEKEIVEKLLALPEPLALYLFTDDQQLQNNIIERVPFGGGCINDTIVHLGNPHLPFGGAGKSGFGSYHGEHSFETFSRKQSILKKPLWPDPDLRYPPYDDTKLTWFKRLFS